MSPTPLLNRPVLAGILVVAPVLEVLEQVLSPLKGGSVADLNAIADHQIAFVVSLLIGTIATVLYIPAFLGLAAHCAKAAPMASRIGAAAAVMSMAGFMAVRAIQAVQLQTVRDGLPRASSADLIDHTAANPVGAPMLVMFLGGSVVGLVSLAIACWRTGLPKPAVGMLGIFPIIDLAAPGHAGTIASHLVLLVALAWIATTIADHSPRAVAIQSLTR